MDLLKLKAEIGYEGMADLARRVGSSPAYLSQMAHGHRKPSPAMCRKLVEADGRLTLAALRPDIYASPHPEAARAAA